MHFLRKAFFVHVSRLRPNEKEATLAEPHQVLTCGISALIKIGSRILDLILNLQRFLIIVRYSLDLSLIFVCL